MRLVLQAYATEGLRLVVPAYVIEGLRLVIQMYVTAAGRMAGSPEKQKPELRAHGHDSHQNYVYQNERVLMQPTEVED